MGSFFSTSNPMPSAPPPYEPREIPTPFKGFKAVIKRPETNFRAPKLHIFEIQEYPGQPDLTAALRATQRRLRALQHAADAIQCIVTSIQRLTIQNIPRVNASDIACNVPTHNIEEKEDRALQALSDCYNLIYKGRNENPIPFFKD